MVFIANPDVPFKYAIKNVRPGMIVQIAGRTPSSAKWFAVNLQCGPSTNPRGDIGLHLCPRFETSAAAAAGGGVTGVGGAAAGGMFNLSGSNLKTLSKFVRNSLQNQQWGFEESFGHFPFKKTGQPFEILILCEENRYKIAVNGQHFTDFEYRIPLQRVNTLCVDGDVELVCVRFENHELNLDDPSAHRDATDQTPDDTNKQDIPVENVQIPRQQSNALKANRPVPGNKSPLLTEPPAKDGSNAVEPATINAAAGFGASRLMYPGMGVHSSDIVSNRNRQKKLKKKSYHKPTKTSDKKWSSTSSSDTSSSSEE